MDAARNTAPPPQFPHGMDDLFADKEYQHVNPRNSASWGAGGHPQQPPRSSLGPNQKKWLIRLGIGALIFTLGAGCGAATAETDPDAKTQAEAKPTPTVTVTATAAPEPMTSQVNRKLSAATKAAEEHGYQVSAHNASEQDTAPDDGWTVCFEQVTYDSVDFAAVPGDAPCPKKDGKPIPWPSMPDVVDGRYAKAVEAVGKATDGDVRLKSAYRDEDVDGSRADDGTYDSWKVCFQSPASGKTIKHNPDVTLWLAEEECPSQKGTYRDETNDPNYTPPESSGSSSSSTSGGGSSGGGASDSDDTSGTCEIVSSSGNCYSAGQFCRAGDVGRSTHAENGRLIHCRDEGSVNRWNY